MIEIRETRDIQDVLQCVPFECQIREKGRDKIPLKDMLYLTAQWFASDPLFRFFLFIEDDRIVGYCAIKVILDKYEGGIYVIRGYRDPGKPELMEMFWELARELGKFYKLDRVLFKAENDKIKESFEQKWGFKTTYTMMERRF